MDAQEITFGLNTFLSVIFGAGGALGVWFKLKGTVNLLDQKVSNLEDDKVMLNSRIDNLKKEVKENRDKSDKSITEITEKMQAMELRIIQAIHDMKRKDG